ncbi:MAG: leucine-rich repeat protein [Oscillospiraceae bacterium]|nr:leucine-rich repeat protein [Oscillospiraceae bacterium]
MQCPHCFREAHTKGACPYCGYDASGDAEKYPLALKPGSILNGRYIVGRVLGQGGFGITYIAWDDRMKERVAIKEYFPSEFAGRIGISVQVHSANQAENFDYGKAQFLEEAKTLAAFNGDSHIVRVYSYFEENGTAYFCMEYVDGLPLDKYLAAQGRRLNAEEANRLLLPLMESLESVHAKGIVHRDIAPDNILVTGDGTAKLIDFGAARYSTGEKSRSLDVILKHGFAPYEQYMRRGRQGPWTDVYALAATYYYAVTGRIPPEAVERRNEDELIPPSTLGARLSPAQEDVLLHALEVLASERIQSMGEFRRAMEDASAQEEDDPALLAQRERELREELARIERKRRAQSEGPRQTEEPKQTEPAAPAGRKALITPAGQKKSRLPLILGAVAVLAAVLIFGVLRSTPVPDGLMYELYIDHAVITRYEGTGSELEIPSRIRGRPVTEIEGYAFYSCRGLTSVTIPDSVTSIGSHAFSYCARLTRITIPDGVTSIEDSTFSYCTALKSVTIPEGVTEIGNYAFHGCKGITRITLPVSIRAIGPYAFQSCPLSRVEYGGTEKQWRAVTIDDNKELLSAEIHFNGK